jgi:hypothetical protein
MRFGVWLPNCTARWCPSIAADGGELDAQMAAFAERVRPRLS